MLDQLPQELLVRIFKQGQVPPNTVAEVAKTNKALRANTKYSAELLFNKYSGNNPEATYKKCDKIFGSDLLWKMLVHLHEPEKLEIFRAAISNNAQAYYNEHKIAPADFIKHGVKIIQFVRDDLKTHIVKLMNNGINFDDIAAIDLGNIGKLELLSSDNVIKCVQQGYFTLESLSAFSNIKINTLTSDKALRCYEMEKFNIPLHELAMLEEEVIKALTSFKSQAIYRTEKYNIGPQELLNLSSGNLEMIKAITSNNAQAYYKEHNIAPANFIKHGVKIIQFVKDDLKPHIVKLMNNGISFDSIAAIDLGNIGKLKLLSSDYVIKCVQQGYLTLESLSVFSTTKINYLIDPDAIACYENPDIGITLQFLAQFSSEKIGYLTNEFVISFYTKGESGITPQELSELDIDVIKAIFFSDDFIDCHIANFCSLRDLAKLNLYEIGIIVYHYKNGCKDLSEIPPSTVIELDGKVMEFTFSITRENPLSFECEMNEYVTPSFLEGFIPHKIEALTSSDATECFTNTDISMTKEFLARFSYGQIEALTSSDARECYLKYGVTPEELGYRPPKDPKYPHTKNSVTKIEALISKNARECYKKDFCALKDLAKINKPGVIDTITKTFLVDWKSKALKSFEDIMNEYNGGTDIMSALAVHDPDPPNEDVELLG